MTTQPALTAAHLTMIVEDAAKGYLQEHGISSASLDMLASALRQHAEKVRALTSPAPSPAAGCEPIPTYSDLRDAINLILPMAKGYVAEHPVGSNQEYVDHVVELLSRIEVVP